MFSQAGKTRGLAALCAIFIAGCGGGGGSTSDSGSPGGTNGAGNASGISMSVDKSSITVSASLSDLPVQSSHLNVTVHNPPAGPHYLVATGTTNVIQRVGGDLLPNGAGESADLAIGLTSQSSLKPGVYTAMLTLRLCTDGTCSAGALVSLPGIPLTYTVTDYASTPTVTFDTTAINLQGLALDNMPPPDPIVHLSLSNLSVYPYIVASVGAGITLGANVYRIDATHASVDIGLKTPQQLGAGTHTDYVTVVACLDSTCTNQIPGSPYTINLTDVVGSTITVDGPQGYTVWAIQDRIHSAVWDNARHQFYVSLDDTQHVRQGLLQIVDPAARTRGASVELPAATGDTLAMSDNAQYLYAGLNDGTIDRLLLPAMTSDAQFPVNPNVAPPMYAGGIQVKPGAPQTIAVVLTNQVPDGFAPPVSSGAAIFDGPTRRPQIVAANPTAPNTGTPVQYLQWDTASASIFGAGGPQLTANLYTLTVDASGLTDTGANLSWSRSVFANNGRLRLAGSLLYHDSGVIIDPYARRVVTTLTTDRDLYGVVPDPAHHKLFIVSGASPIAPTLHVLNLDTLAPIADVLLPGIVFDVVDAERYGADGMVFRTEAGLVFLSGGLISN